MLQVLQRQHYVRLVIVRNHGATQKALYCVQLGPCSAGLHRKKRARDEIQIEKGSHGAGFLLAVTPMGNKDRDHVEKLNSNNPRVLH